MKSQDVMSAGKRKEHDCVDVQSGGKVFWGLDGAAQQAVWKDSIDCLAQARGGNYGQHDDEDGWSHFAEIVGKKVCSLKAEHFGTFRNETVLKINCNKVCFYV
jgi:hypothetical protein